MNNVRMTAALEPIESPEDSSTLHASAPAATVPAGGVMKKSGHRRFKVNAYTGSLMRMEWSKEPVVVDLQGMKWTNQQRPILLQHDNTIDGVLGQTTSLRIEGSNLVVECELMPTNNIKASKVIGLAEDGFQWQASIGCDVLSTQRIREGDKAIVNGKEIVGPARVVRASRLREISVCTLGADDQTTASLAASAAHSKENPMSASVINDVADDNKTEAPVTPAPVATVQASAPVTTALAQVDEDAIADKVAAKLLAAQAKADNLQATRNSRAQAPAIHAVETFQGNVTVLKAAAYQACGINGLDEEFDDKTLQAAHTKYKGGIGLQELLLEAAYGNGYTGRASFRDEGSMRPILRAAFATHDIADILSATVNKNLLQGFNSVDNTWRQVASTRPVNDFKTVTSYRLTGGFEFEEMSGRSEFKMAVAGNAKYENAARTYGIATNVSREDIINDDLTSLSQIPSRIGRGAALKLNRVFWEKFLDNLQFFTAALKNLGTGAKSELSIDGLTMAEQMFLDQTDDDGYPLAVSPTILLVPTALNVKARNLMQSTEIRDPQSNKAYGVQNPHAGKYQVITTPYLSNAKFPGNSNSAYYLLSAPADLSVIELCFLNGQQAPTVEQADLDFSLLGIQMRGYFDFGVAHVEPRGGLKMDGK